MTSPAMENSVCTAQVYHFTHSCRGPSGAWGPRFIEPPEPPVFLRHWLDLCQVSVSGDWFMQAGSHWQSSGVILISVRFSDMPKQS